MTDVLFLAILKAKAAGDDRAAAALRALASDPEAFADAVRPPTEEEIVPLVLAPDQGTDHPKAPRE